MIRRPPRSTQSRSSAASDVYKRQDQNIFGREALVAHLDRMRIDNPCAASEDLYAGIDQQILIDSVEASDLGVLVGDQFVPVEAAIAKRPTKTRGIMECFAEFGSVHEDLLRDAADVDASAAQVPLLR